VREMGRRIATSPTEFTVLLFVVLALVHVAIPVKAQALTTIVSGWMTQPVVLDGRITTPGEWSDTVPVYLVLRHSVAGAMRDKTRVWIKNDLTYFYVLVSVPWPANDIDAADWFDMSPRVGLKDDAISISVNNALGDGQTDETGIWIEDTKRIPPGTTDIEGRASYDGGSYWFEFRRKLNTLDRCDVVLVPGQSYPNVELGFSDRSRPVPGKSYTRYSIPVVLQLAPVLPSITSAAPEQDAIVRASLVNFTASIVGHLSRVVLVVDKEYNMSFNERTGMHEASLRLADGTYKWHVRALGVLGNVTRISERSLIVDQKGTLAPMLPWYVIYWYIPVIPLAAIVAIAAIMISRRGRPKLPTKLPEVKPLKIERPRKPPTREHLLKELEELHRSGRIAETAYRRLRKKYETKTE